MAATAKKTVITSLGSAFVSISDLFPAALFDGSPVL